MLHTLIDLILPPRCGACQKIVLENCTLCSDCFQKAQFISAPYCQTCGLPFDLDDQGENLCLSCHQNPPLFSKGRFCLPYDDFTKPMILSFKHGDRCDLAPVFAKWMEMCARELLSGCDLIVPVPLHWKRLMRRRFNQAALLARHLSHLTQITHDPLILKRIRSTKSQGHLSPSQRHLNVRGAFHCATDLSGQTVLLVDDVFTTGATVTQCCRALLQSGAKDVRVLTLTRVLKNRLSTSNFAQEGIDFTL